jgi:hypothetical protein
MPRTITAAAQVADDLDINVAAFSRHLLAEGKVHQTVRVYTWATARLTAHLREQGMPVAVSNIRREHVESFFAAERDPC